MPDTIPVPNLAPQPATATPMSESLGLPAGMSPYYGYGMGMQQPGTGNLGGLFTMGPGGTPTPPPQFQMPEPGPTSARTFGPGEGAARRRESMQNMISSGQKVANMFVQAAQQKQQREYQSVLGPYTAAVKSLQQAPAIIQQGKQMQWQAAQIAAKGSAATPEEQQQAQQLKEQGDLLVQQGQLSQLNATTQLKEMAADTKKSRIISRAWGVDSSNRISPERQALEQMYQKQFNVDQGAAHLMAMQPMTMQPSALAEQQAQAVQMGVAGKPATGGQLLSAQESAARLAEQQHIADQRSLEAENKQITDALSKGQVPELDANGDPKKTPDGHLVMRNLKKEELTNPDNPHYNLPLAEKLEDEQSKIDLRSKQAQATTVRAQADMIRAQKTRMEMAQANDPAQLQAWVKEVTDPKSGVTIGNVPAAARTRVMALVSGQGLTIAKKLDNDETKRMDLSNNAISNLHVAKDIWQRRPDLFGPEGWASTKFQYALNGGDPDAVQFQAAINLSSLPMVGIHGVRGKWALEELSKLSGNFYMNHDAMGRILDEELRSAGEFATAGGRPGTTTPAGAQTPTPSTPPPAGGPAPTRAAPATAKDPGGLF